jgi:uncharacterized membrane protein (DUF485 family)
MFPNSVRLAPEPLCNDVALLFQQLRPPERTLSNCREGIMSEQAFKWDAIYARPEFMNLVRQRRSVVLRLFVASMLFFFSIPLIVVFLPDFFKVALTGAVNVGLVYLIAQYLVGTVIAIRYTVLLKRLDEMAGDLSENRWVAIDTAPAL